MASSPVAASSPAAAEPVPASTPVASAPPAEASAPVVVPPVPAPAPKAALIEVHGDDAMLGITSSGYGMPTITQQTEPANTQTILRAQFGDGVTISNLAEGGTASTLVNMMNGVDGGGPPFAQRMATSKADIELLNHAVNDDLSQSLAPCADALVAWVQAVRAAGKVAVLEEPNPTCDDNHPYLANYVSVMGGIAQQYSVPIVKQFDYIQTLPNWCSHFSAGLYPDDYINSVKAQREAAVLVPIIKNIVGAQ